MEQSFNPAIIVWSVIGLIVFVSFAVNAYLKVKAYRKKIRHIFIDGDSVVVVSCDEEAPMGSIALEVLENNHLAA